MDNSRVPADRSASSVQMPPANRRNGLPFQRLARLIYVHNPFYAISAALVFWGLESSFNLNVYKFQMFALMGGLVGYTLILAVAAFAVVRLGRVWDDGRSLLLLVVLMLLAIAISFDGALTKYPTRGTLCSIGGLLFAVLVSEGLLRGLAIRLPWLFRGPYYLLLGLFFLYPVALRWTVFGDPYAAGIQWALLAFPTLAAIVCLMLLPAVRRGREYASNSGTPWPWPWFPWTAFFMLGLGVCGRSYYLCMSMHMAGGFTTIFGPWFLVPFLLAVNVLLLEGGLAAGSIRVQRAAMLAPAALMLLALVPPSGNLSYRFVYEIFLPTFGAGPLFLTALLVAAFYGWAIMRRVPLAVEALSAALLALAFIAPETGSGDGLCLPPQAYPILALGAIHGLIALLRPSAIRWLVSVCCGVFGISLAFRETPLVAYHGVVPAHLLLAAMLLLGVLFSGRFARWLQHASAAILLLFALAAMTGRPAWINDMPRNWLLSYPAIVIMAAASYGLLVRNAVCFAAAAATLVCWLGIGSVQGYRQLRIAVSGLDYILYGALSLIVAMIISLGKTGLLQRRLARQREVAKPGDVVERRLP